MLVAMATFTHDDIRSACKPRDSWWTVLFADPFAVRLTRWIANRTPFGPNEVTAAAALFAAAAAACLLSSAPAALLAGAGLFAMSFLLDCVDGKLARLTGTASVAGVWFGSVLDRLRFIGCAAALLLG